MIHPNVAIKNHQYQGSVSKDSVEEDVSDLYGRDDDYSDGSGIVYYLNALLSNNINKGKKGFQILVSISIHCYVFQILKRCLSISSSKKERKYRTGIDN